MYIDTLTKFINKTVHFKDNIYDKVVEYILQIQSKYCPVLVLFANSGVEDESFNDYHYQYLKSLLEKNKIFYGTKLLNSNLSYMYKHIVIVEVISSNLRLSEICHSILENFDDELPNISYISLVKELDRKEMIRTIEKKNHELQVEKEEAERKERERIKREKEEQENLLQEQKILCEIQHCVNCWYKPTRTSLKCFSMYNYYPTTCDFEASTDEWNIRNLIWNFKANPNKPTPISVVNILHQQASVRVVKDASKCLKHFFGGYTNMLTLVCIPSSKLIITERRYKDFSSDLCDKLSMINAYDYVRVIQDGEAKHTGGTTQAQYELDRTFFAGKKVLLFDDVITSGKSMEQFRRRLEQLGAIVIGGFSIGVTKHQHVDFNPIENLNGDASNTEPNNFDLPF